MTRGWKMGRSAYRCVLGDFVPRVTREGMLWVTMRVGGRHVGVTVSRCESLRVLTDRVSVERSDQTYSVWCGRSSQMGLFKKFCAPVRPPTLGRRHGPTPASGIADRVSVAYTQARCSSWGSQSGRLQPRGKGSRRTIVLVGCHYQRVTIKDVCG